MNKNKTERFFSPFSAKFKELKEIKPSIFEDSHLFFNKNQIESKRNFIANTFVNPLSREKTETRKIKSFYEKNSKNKQLPTNISLEKLFDNKNKNNRTTFERRSTVKNIKIKNLEVLNKLKSLCTEYILSPEKLQGKIVKYVIKSIEALNESVNTLFLIK